jgi:hypothetical protein
MGMDEMEKNVADALENEKTDREKLADDTKMALEEEKMLRAQDIGIIRFNLNEGIKEAQDAAKGNKQELDKMLEEEREDRNSQNVDLLDKIDKEKRDRVSALADMQHKFEDDNEHLSNKLQERIGESIKSEEKARGLEFTKINQDIDDLHEAILAKISASNAEVEEKIMAQEKKDNDKFLVFTKKVDDDNKELRKLIT